LCGWIVGTVFWEMMSPVWAMFTLDWTQDSKVFELVSQEKGIQSFHPQFISYAMSKPTCSYWAQSVFPHVFCTNPIFHASSQLWTHHVYHIILSDWTTVFLLFLLLISSWIPNLCPTRWVYGGYLNWLCGPFVSYRWVKL